MNVIKYHPVSKTQGYVVHKVESKYHVAFATQFQTADGTVQYKKEGDSKSLGRPLIYTSPFTADYVIRKEILPLYKKGA